MAVNGLIYRYARLKGEFESLEAINRWRQKRLEQLAKELDESNRSIATAKAEMAALQLAAKLGFEVDLDGTPARNTRAPRQVTSLGKTTRVLLDTLAKADGVPLTTAELAKLVADPLGINTDHESLQRLQESLRYHLKRLRGRNIVKRACAASIPGEFTKWVLVGNAE